MMNFTGFVACLISLGLLVSHIDLRNRYETVNVSGNYRVEKHSTWLGEKEIENSTNEKFSEVQLEIELLENKMAELLDLINEQRILSSSEFVKNESLNKSKPSEKPNEEYNSSTTLPLNEENNLNALVETWNDIKNKFGNLEPHEWEDELRSELSVESYESYRLKNEYPISIEIAEVVEGSQADYAGFFPGDEIVAYDGKRIYNYHDFYIESVKGELGEIVTIDVIRDGIPVQLIIERGVLGVVGQ